jgi:hypothetical protein
MLASGVSGFASRARTQAELPTDVPPGTRPAQAFATVVLVFVVITLDTVVINVALPSTVVISAAARRRWDHRRRRSLPAPSHVPDTVEIIPSALIRRTRLALRGR